MRANDFEIVTSHGLKAMGPAIRSALALRLTRLAGHKIYVTFDVDFVDAASAPGTLFRERQVHALPEFGFHRGQLRVQPGSHRVPAHREPTLPGLRTTVRETEEVEGLRLALAAGASLLGRKAPHHIPARFMASPCER